jgi:uncharacterized membrane protein
MANLNKQTFVNKSNQVSPWVILLILVVGSFFSALIPPLQSPDEIDHIKRAYLLSEGRIILGAPPEGSKTSGGMIDSGLSTYFDAYAVLIFKPDRKLSADEINMAKSIKWTGIKKFSGAPGTGFYFPIIYMPQAIGLKIGEILGLTIDTSYLLARFMALASIAVILFAAFNVCTVNPLTIALLIIPMSVFQFSSASLDGVSTALAVFSIATFLRISDKKTNASPWLFYALTLSVALVATSRAHLLPLLALVLVASFYLQKKKFFYVFAFALFFVLAWTVIASKTTVGFSDIVGASTASVALFYIKNPLAFFNVLITTLSSDLIVFYRESFLGILGWLDTRFSPETYNSLFKCIFWIGLLSVSVKNLKTDWIPRLVLLFSAFASILLIFFALLITWNHHPASLIQGVQGRYLLVPMIMIAYAISGGLNLYEGIFRKTALLLVILLGAFTIYSTPRLLIKRYYMEDEQQPEQISMVMQPSSPLVQNSPILLFMSKAHERNPQPLKRIGILFGTYVRKNPGHAELRLTTSDDQTLAIPFDLPDLVDNHYKYFELGSMPYSSGQIVYLTGGGISTWEAREVKGSAMTCLIYEYTNGKKRYTRGCPRDD